MSGPTRVSELPPDLQPEAQQPPPQAPPAPAIGTGAAPQPQDLGHLHRLGVEQGMQGMPARRPFGLQESRLGHWPANPGFAPPRYFNDTPGRIQRALAAGYRHYRDPHTGQNVQLIVGRAEGGGGMQAFLMEIPMEFYKADFEAKQANLDVIDRTIKAGRHNQEAGDKRYGGVQMRVTGARRPIST